HRAYFSSVSSRIPVSWCDGGSPARVLPRPARRVRPARQTLDGPDPGCPRGPAGALLRDPPGHPRALRPAAGGAPARARRRGRRVPVQRARGTRGLRADRTRPAVVAGTRRAPRVGPCGARGNAALNPLELRGFGGADTLSR